MGARGRMLAVHHDTGRGKRWEREMKALLIHEMLGAVCDGAVCFECVPRQSALGRRDSGHVLVSIRRRQEM